MSLNSVPKKTLDIPDSITQLHSALHALSEQVSILANRLSPALIQNGAGCCTAKQSEGMPLVSEIGGQLISCAATTHDIRYQIEHLIEALQI